MNIKISRFLMPVVFSLVFVAGCASTSGRLTEQDHLSESVLKARTIPAILNVDKTEEIAIREKIRRFRQALKKPKFADSDWRLHDDLLDAYIKLKGASGTNITIPGGARTTLHLPAFCLNSNRAIPSATEPFFWRRSDPRIPYFKEIIRLASSRSQASQEDFQTLLWNLQDRVSWEDYPQKLQKLLKSIDPNAALKLPSKLREGAKNALFDVLAENVEGVGQAQDAVSSIKGRFRDFEEIKSSIESFRSQYPLEESDEIHKIETSALYAATAGQDGYSSRDVTIYNPGESEEAIDLAEYYLEPRRKDVQRIGLAGTGSNPQGIISELEDLLFGDLLRLGIGFTPGVNDVADAYELLFGRDFITNTVLSGRERMLSGFGLIIGSGQGYRYVKRAIHAPARYVKEFEIGLEKAGSRVALRLDEAEAKTALRKTEKSLAEERRASRIRSYSAEEANAKHRFQEAPPYKPGTKVIEYKSIKDDYWVRVHGPQNQQGDWMMRKEAIEGLSASEIKAKYSLQYTPTHVSDVRPAVGTTVRRGRVAKNFGGHLGAVQYEILDVPQESWFQNMRSINGK